VGTKTITVFVSDIDQSEIPAGQTYQLSIRHPDGSTQQLDISEKNYHDLKLQGVGKTLKKRGRKPGSATGAAGGPRRRRPRQNSKPPATPDLFERTQLPRLRVVKHREVGLGWMIARPGSLDRCCGTTAGPAASQLRGHRRGRAQQHRPLGRPARPAAPQGTPWLSRLQSFVVVGEWGGVMLPA